MRMRIWLTLLELVVLIPIPVIIEKPDLVVDPHSNIFWEIHQSNDMNCKCETWIQKSGPGQDFKFSLDSAL